jgi:hypothetical protein
MGGGDQYGLGGSEVIMSTQRVTISKSGHLYVIKKGGREVAYAETKVMAKRKAQAIRDGTWGR